MKKRHTGLIISISAMIASFMLALFGFGILFFAGTSLVQTSHGLKESFSPSIEEDTDTFNFAVQQELDDRSDPPTLTREQMITSAQATVYTIYTGSNQGSGFLYNTKGDIVTNAHVVEGNTSALIKSHDGNEYPGTVIGYSSETDIALIRVPELIGHTPFPVNTTDHLPLGDSVIALGSPNDHEAVSTGTILDDYINFSIGSYQYTNLYEMNADISEGSSGGPLISETHGQIFAINSAENIDDDSIGYSLPLYEVAYLLSDWSAHPMNETEVSFLFDEADNIDTSTREEQTDIELTP
ncbi:S1C family serine protease [Lentibacillus sp. JNUCC-1]|uniref:S1C family serine protease n=1 Tax=Lentibacillus sp. JNUCC-1 TaxID=2654513 RepID=UPI0018D20A40|nr:serine protease [Lentibacillus sp. JNUCC-1]